MEELERVYVVPLGKVYEKPRIKRAKLAAKELRSFISRHMKVSGDSVRISSSANSALWASGIKKPPRRIRVVANRDKEGLVRVSLVEEKEAEAKLSQKAARKAEKRKKEGEQKAARRKETGAKAETKQPGAEGQPVEKQSGEKKAEAPKQKKRKPKPRKDARKSKGV
jgi:large subunit ribosomal protein L31e